VPTVCGREEKSQRMGCGVRSKAARSCLAQSWDKSPAELCYSGLALETSPQVGSSGAPHLFQPTSVCRQVKASSRLAVRLCSPEQVASAVVPIQLQTRTALMDICLTCSSKSKAVDSSLTGDATEISEEHATDGQIFSC